MAETIGSLVFFIGLIVIFGVLGYLSRCTYYLKRIHKLLEKEVKANEKARRT